MNRIKNAKRQTIDSILFLQGVFKNDCDNIENFFHDRLLGNNHVDIKYYDKIPLTFTTIDLWPKETNLLCWNCNRLPKSRPWFEPQSIDPVSKGEVGVFVSPDKLIKNHKSNEFCINVKGIFCSCNCVMRHILNTAKNLSDRLNKIAMLLFIHEIFTGRKVIDIEPAPHVTEMIQYGGNLSETEYQKKIDELNSVKHTNDSFINNCRVYFSKLHLEE